MSWWRRLPPWTRDARIMSFALLGLGIAVLAVGMLVQQFDHPVAEPGTRIMFRPGVDIPMPVGAGLIILSAVVAVVSLARNRLHTRIGRWAMGLGLFSALVNPLLALPAYYVTKWVEGEIPGDWGTPFEFAWVISAILAMALGLLAPEEGRRGMLLVPAVLGIAVLTFVLAEVIVPH